MKSRAVDDAGLKLELGDYFNINKNERGSSADDVPISLCWTIFGNWYAIAASGWMKSVARTECQYRGHRICV